MQFGPDCLDKDIADRIDNLKLAIVRFLDSIGCMGRYKIRGKHEVHQAEKEYENAFCRRFDLLD